MGPVAKVVSIAACDGDTKKRSIRAKNDGHYDGVVRLRHMVGPAQRDSV